MPDDQRFRHLISRRLHFEKIEAAVDHADNIDTRDVETPVYEHGEQVMLLGPPAKESRAWLHREG